MKVLIVGREACMQSLLEGLLAGTPWVVTHCRTLEEAARALQQTLEPFHYILAEPEVGPVAESALGSAWQAAGRPPLIRFDPRGDHARPTEGAGYGLYSLAADSSDDSGGGDGQWVLEYHAPCSGRSPP